MFSALPVMSDRKMMKGHPRKFLLSQIAEMFIYLEFICMKNCIKWMIRCAT